MSIIKLCDMKRGQKGTIHQMPKGRNARLRLTEIGLRMGSAITMKNAMPYRGPVIIMAGQTEIALGHHMAEKILVHLSKEAS